jgi:hypothetical protein
MRNSTKLIAAIAGAAFLALCLTGCAAMEGVLDTTMSVFDSEGEEVETTVGDAVADSADDVGGIVSTLLGTNPIAAAVAGAAVAALAGTARRRKKKAKGK